MGLVQDTATFIKNAWDAVEEMGGDVPAQNKNLANLTAGIASIPTGPSLKGLKKALQDGIAPTQFPVGMEIPDTWSGNDNPLIVTQYLNSSNNSSYGGAEGVILIRKYVDPVSQEFGSSFDYTTSAIKSFLDTEYLNNCSNSLKSIISDISFPYSNTLIKGKFFLMSDREVCSNRLSNAEGIMWDYWKQKTGLSSPDWAANSGRIMRDNSGTPHFVWLRSRFAVSSTEVCIVTPDGFVGNYSSTYARGVLPACFIGKD